MCVKIMLNKFCFFFYSLDWMIVFMFFFLMTAGKIFFWFDWLINILKKLRMYKVIE